MKFIEHFFTSTLQSLNVARMRGNQWETLDITVAPSFTKPFTFQIIQHSTAESNSELVYVPKQ